MIDFDDFWTTTPISNSVVNNSSNKLAVIKTPSFPLTSSFQIDLDPFSSSSSATASQTSLDHNKEITISKFDPFLDITTAAETDTNTKMSEVVEGHEIVNGFDSDFVIQSPPAKPTRTFDEGEKSEEINDITWNRENSNSGGVVMETLVEEQEQQPPEESAAKKTVTIDDSSSSDEDYVPPTVAKNQRLSQTSATRDATALSAQASLEIKDPFRQNSFNPEREESDEENDNMDDAFQAFAGAVPQSTATDMDGIQESLGELHRSIRGFIRHSINF